MLQKSNDIQEAQEMVPQSHQDKLKQDQGEMTERVHQIADEYNNIKSEVEMGEIGM